MYNKDIGKQIKLMAVYQNLQRKSVFQVKVLRKLVCCS